jgi:quercetin dioxygenase-like cupin family protein
MKITDLGKVEITKMDMPGADKVSKQIPISKNDGTPSMSLRVFTFEPGGHTPYHTHPFEHLNYIIEGSGVLVTESGEERPVKKGDFVLVLPNEKHQYRNISKDSPMIMICGAPREYE